MIKKSNKVKQENNNVYLEVTQDGVARITVETPQNILGIYTEGLETCLAIAIFGSEGLISVIHATHKLLLGESIIKEIELYQDKISHFSIFYNPSHYPNKEEDEELLKESSIFVNQLPQALFNRIKENLIGKEMLCEANNGFVAIGRNGRYLVNNKPMNICCSPNKDIRHKINQVNNYYLTDEEETEADIQYDGRIFTPLPKLKKLDNEIEELLKTNKFIISNMNYSAGLLRQEVTNHFRESERLKELAQLLHSTSVSFFHPNKFSEWKEYPQNKLTERYRGHTLRYFYFEKDQNTQAENLGNKLKDDGFTVIQKVVNEKPSLTVDLTTSTLKN